MKIKDIIGKLMEKMMLSCDHATRLMVKREYDKISMMESMQLKLHNSMCEFCRKFEIQNKNLSHEIKRMTEHNGHHHCLHYSLDDKKKEEIREQLEELRKN